MQARVSTSRPRVRSNSIIKAAILRPTARRIPSGFAFGKKPATGSSLPDRDEWSGGDLLTDALADLGYRSIYLIAGPHMLDTMLREHRLCRLYQTISLQLLGGESFHTLLPGPPLGSAGQLRLQQLYYDPAGHEHCAQLFACFEIAGSS